MAEDYSEPKPEELEMILEETTGQLTKGTTAERIAALNARIAMLENYAQRIGGHRQSGKLGEAEATRELETIALDLREARAQLLGYQQQQEGRN